MKVKELRDVLSKYEENYAHKKEFGEFENLDICIEVHRNVTLDELLDGLDIGIVQQYPNQLILLTK